jgi:RNA polymerase sigma factor (sigma-70 family)
MPTPSANEHPSDEPVDAARLLAPDPDEQLLIGRIRAGDMDAFAQLFSEHRRAATAYARSLTRCAADADDLVAEAFTRLLAIITSGETPITRFRPYLFGIVKNLVRTTHRRESRTNVSDEIDQIVDAHTLHRDSTGDALIDGIDRAVAFSAWSTLPDSWREVLWSMEVLGERPRHLAVGDARGAHSISALAHRAREGLRNAYLSQSVTADRPSCNGLSDRLGAFVRGHLGVREQTRVASHLDGCSRCRQAVEGIVQLAGELRLRQAA